MKTKIYTIVYRTLLILISSIFIFAGMDKVMCTPDMVNAFNIFGIPQEFMVIIGFTEIILAVFLHTKYFTKIASHALITILSFGLLFHFLCNQYMAMIIPTSMITLLIITMYLGQKIRNLPKW